MKQIKEYGCAGRKENGRWGPQGHPKNPNPNKSKKQEKKGIIILQGTVYTAQYTIIIQLIKLQNII